MGYEIRFANGKGLTCDEKVHKNQSIRNEDKSYHSIGHSIRGVGSSRCNLNYRGLHKSKGVFQLVTKMKRDSHEEYHENDVNVIL